MSDVSSRFRAFLIADANIARLVGGRVHEDHVPQRNKPLYPFIWYRKRQAQGTETLDSDNGEDASFHYFDVEVVSKNQSTAKELETLVRARCSCYRGTYGDSTVQGIFVNDQSADYEPQSNGGDDGLTVASLDVQVCT